MQLARPLCLLFALAGLIAAPDLSAWGQLGHGLIGNAAVARLTPAAHLRVTEILGVPPDDPVALARAVDEACSWPDSVRETPEWSWTAPLHYVNIPRGTDRYDRQRDCPADLCLTEALPHYVAELGQPGIGPDRRRQAFAWVCHLTGDLHQPLHAGFADDHGGNDFAIEYRGEAGNLHTWWDDVLEAERLDWRPGDPLPGWLLSVEVPAGTWSPQDVVAWTEAAHTLALARAYPPGPIITPEFADASWELARQQWRLAVARLAWILESELTPAGGQSD